MAVTDLRQFSYLVLCLCSPMRIAWSNLSLPGPDTEKMLQRQTDRLSLTTQAACARTESCTRCQRSTMSSAAASSCRERPLALPLWSPANTGTLSDCMRPAARAASQSCTAHENQPQRDSVNAGTVVCHLCVAVVQVQRCTGVVNRGVLSRLDHKPKDLLGQVSQPPGLSSGSLQCVHLRRESATRRKLTVDALQSPPS